MIPSSCSRKYLVSNDIMSAISKYNNCEICQSKITILLINERHVLMSYFLFFFWVVQTCFLFHWILIMLYHILNWPTFSQSHMIQNLWLGLNFKTYLLSFLSLFSFISVLLNFKTPNLDFCLVHCCRWITKITLFFFFFFPLI